MLHDKLTAAIQSLQDGPTPTAEDIANLIGGVLHDEGWHAPGDCPECPALHCPAEGDHYGRSELVEAVQMLHGQAHNGPTEPLDARRCTREPCVTVGGGLTTGSDVRGMFAPGSRVIA